MESIAAVVVTHNRIDNLIRCIDSLRNGNIKPEWIIVIDNESKDGTSEWLEKQSDLISISQQNSGSAGGYNSGIRYALKTKCDWILTMDDDTEADKYMIENLLKYSCQAICLRAIHVNGSKYVSYFIGYFDFTLGRTFFMESDRQNIKEYFHTNLGCFEGMLIRRNLVEKIGLPDKEFFTLGDDIIYGFLISEFTDILVVKNAVLKKQINPDSRKIQERSYYTADTTSLYYGIRNQWLIFAYLSQAGLLHRAPAYLLFILKFLYTLLISILKPDPESFIISLKAFWEGRRSYYRKLNSLRGKNE